MIFFLIMEISSTKSTLVSVILFIQTTLFSIFERISWYVFLPSSTPANECSVVALNYRVHGLSVEPVTWTFLVPSRRLIIFRATIVLPFPADIGCVH